MLCTLYLRAYESTSEHSILNDTYASEALDRIDYDKARLYRTLRPKSNQFLVALRTRQIDTWTREFLDQNPDAVVLHLGCGLDSRVFRVEAPTSTRWFDVDIPEVIDLRRQVYPSRNGYRMIGASVTDDDWLEEIPDDRPTLVIAEGLLMYLTEQEVRRLLGRLTGRFDTGELVFDGLAGWAGRLSKLVKWGVRDIRILEQWNPRLRCLEEHPSLSYYPMIPKRGVRATYKMLNGIRPLRKMQRLFRFAF